MPKTSRRDFLRWTLAGSGLLLAGAASVLEPAPARAVTRLGAPTQQTALFMGTMVSITVACPSSTQAHDAMDLAFAEGRRLEALLTRHDAAAPLGVLNSQGSLRDVPPELLNVWQRAHGICHLTGGAFDATVLPLVRLLESRSNPEGELELPESDLREALALVDTEAVYAGRDGMRLERQGMGLTLDGIAKGHIVDAMSAVLLRAGCENHLINAGGDILARGHKAPGVFWRVAVEDPEKRGHYPQVLELYNQAIATSGGYEMHYDAEGRHHHLLDPSTGRSPVLGSMSVLAATCMQADALATGLSVLPAGEALTLADSLSQHHLPPLACGSLILIVHGCKKPVPQGTGFFRFRHRPFLFPGKPSFRDLPRYPAAGPQKGHGKRRQKGRREQRPGRLSAAGGHPGRATWSAAASGGCRKA